LPVLGETRFTEFLVRENVLDEYGFEEWIFCPGMLFNAKDKWWGDQGKRDKPHEGLDLCLYRDQQDRILRLDEKTKIPVLYDGMVIRIFDDFIGKSVMMEHSLPDSDTQRFYTIYGHTNPHRGLHAGRIVKGGDIIATLAQPSKSKNDLLPHLHISLGWTAEVISYDKLDWETIGTPNTLKLLDPLHVMGWHYLLLESPLPP
jgi:hypothetical protein